MDPSLNDSFESMLPIVGFEKDVAVSTRLNSTAQFRRHFERLPSVPENEIFTPTIFEPTANSSFWDNSYTFIPPVEKTDRISTSTQFNVDAMFDKTPHEAVLRKLAMFIEDDVSNVVFENVTLQYLEQIVNAAVKLKFDVQESLIFLDANFADVFIDQQRNTAYANKTALIEFIKKAQCFINSRQPDRSSAYLQKIIKTERVDADSDKLVGEMQALSDEIEIISTANVQQDVDVYRLADKYASVSKRADRLAKEARSLCNDAIDSNNEEAARNLDQAGRILAERLRECDANIDENKSRFGIVGQSEVAKVKLPDLPAPKFSGEFSSGEKLDFFTFKEEFYAFINPRALSDSMKLKVLLNSCLEGEAKVACKQMKSVKDVFDHLNQLYGDPQLVVRQKLDEIIKLGGCPSSIQKRRTWAINILSKLNSLHDLCKTFGMENRLYHSDIVSKIKNSLPADAAKDLRNDLKNHRNDHGYVEESVLFQRLVVFLGEYVSETTFDLHLDASNPKSSIPPQSSKSTKSYVTNLADGLSSSGGSGCLAGGSCCGGIVGAVSGFSGVVSGGGSGASSGASGGASSQSSGNSRNGGKSGNGAKSKNSKAVNNGSNRSQNQSAKNQPIAFTGPESVPQVKDCKACGGRHTHLYYCPTFQAAPVRERIKITSDSKICYRCLRMDSNADFGNIDAWWDGHVNDCRTKFTCEVGKCGNMSPRKRRNILMCNWHVSVNKDREAQLIQTLDQAQLPSGLSYFFVNGWICTSSSGPKNEYVSDGFRILPDIEGESIFMLQVIPVYPDREALLFFDSGCAGAAVSDAALAFMDHEVIRPGPTIINVAGGEKVKFEGGDVRLFLELCHGKSKATITALNMSQVTNEFPVWELTEAFNEILSGYLTKYPQGKPLPTVEREVGGQAVDLMLGSRYNVYFPRPLYFLPNGLGIYKSVIKGARGHQGVIGGPYAAWLQAKDSANFLGPSVYLTMELKAYRNQTKALKYLPLLSTENPENPEYACELEKSVQDCCLDHLVEKCDIFSVNTVCSIQTVQKQFNEVQNLATEATYRCVSCRSCPKCKKGDQLEMLSLRDEVEQALIESCVMLIPEEKKLVAKLPFILDPAVYLTPNKHQAYKVLETQLRMFEKYPEMREDTLKSHQKLLNKQYVCRVDDLSQEEKDMISSSPGEGYVIPWRTVYKETSLSTPCRLVFDASARTPGGESLNSTLAKGPNRLIKIAHLLIRFRRQICGLTCDISMAYNQLHLDPTHYKWQQYLWVESLTLGDPVVRMVVKTLIYGVRPSGQLTGEGIQQVAAHCLKVKPEYARGAEVVSNNSYVDDLLDSCGSQEEAMEIIEAIRYCLGLANMTVKDFTVSGTCPSEAVSSDGKSVGVLGYIWLPEQDVLKLDIKELFFGRVKRGKKPEPVKGDFGVALKEKFTLRVLLSKTAGVYDPLGLVTPVMAKLKMDLHSITRLKPGWDDLLPERFLPVWIRNLEIIQEFSGLTFKRTIIPVDAVDIKVQLIVSVDASDKLGIAAVHSRVRKKSGGFHVQLVAAKSKIVSGSTIPRAELKAAVAGVVLGHVVGSNLGEQLEKIFHVTDSSIVLHWIHQDERPMQIGVRNSVVEIRRFSDKKTWYHVETHNNLADLGTRFAEVKDITENSEWQVGKPWMSLSEDELPIRTVDQLKLSPEDAVQVSAELKPRDISGHVLHSLVDKVSDRYCFSKYLVDPCMQAWDKTLRLMSSVYAVIRHWKSYKRRPGQSRIDDHLVQVSSEIDQQAATNYFFKKATAEVKHFAKQKQWKDVSVPDPKTGILHYSARILDGQEIEDVEQCMYDLQPLHFVKPMVERFSPVAYSIMLYCHRSLVRHRNATDTLRESRTLAFIINGRSLAEEVRDSCMFCRRYKARLLKVEMGNVHENRLTIAPVFWFSQVDIMGPFLATCEHNHRSSVKIWGLVFKDPASGAVMAHVMQSYNASAFVLAYTRFATRFGHPKKLFIDAGSQLVKGCKELQFSLVDIKNTLNSTYQVGIEFETGPVGGHNYQGAVERSIQEVKKLFYKVYQGLKMDILAYETAFCWVSNELNNMPMCLGSRTTGLEHLDLITPSRLIHGRNNRRAMAGPCRIDVPSRLIKQMETMYKAWWTVWKTEKLLDYIPRPAKWLKSSYRPAVGDVVIFPREEGSVDLGERAWRTGRVQSLKESADGAVREVVIAYKNQSEKQERITTRAVRRIAVIFQEGELELIQSLNEAAKQANVDYQVQAPSAHLVRIVDNPSDYLDEFSNFIT